VEIARHPARFGIVLALALAALVVGLMNASATPPSNFMEGGSTGGDKDIRAGAAPGFDWANGPSPACTLSGGTIKTINCPGTGGLFDGGTFDSTDNTKVPTPPSTTADGTVGVHHIDAIAFGVDPISTDVGACSPSAGGLTQPPCVSPQVTCGKGDPTVYTGAGGEKNGDSLVKDSTGGKAVETFSLSGVPPKDEVQNIYAVSRSGFSTSDPLNDAASGNGKEVFFGGERNFTSGQGDSHFDFEFLQSNVGLVTTSPCSSSNEGNFDGHRTHGDFAVSIDYTNGGALGGFSLHQWHCNKDTASSDSKGWITDSAVNPNSLTGTVCDFAAGASGTDSGVRFGTEPHYQLIACQELIVGSGTCPTSTITPPACTEPLCPQTAVVARTNDQGQVECGGWDCRDGSGNRLSFVDTNKFFEGGVNLLSLGFSGCISTFIPHTRSSQSFTATLKDFQIIPFNTCVPSTTLSLTTSPLPNAGSDILVHKGDSVTFTFTETNDSTLGTPPLLNPSVTMTSTPAGATCTPTKSGQDGDTNNDGKLDRGEAWVFSCSVTFNTAGSFTIKGTAHGTFNGRDVTFCADPNNPPANTICDQDEQAQIVVRVISPSTTLQKSASPTSGVSPVSVTYTYTETNGSTGGNGTTDLAISNVTVTDDKCGAATFVSGDTNSNTKLDVGEIWTFTCGPQSLTTTTTNTATASGTDALGKTVTFCADPSIPPDGTICSQTERDTATVTVTHPGTLLTGVTLAKVTVVYTYKETNTGDVQLHDVSVSDTNCGTLTTPTSGDTNSNGKLDPAGPGGTPPAETWVFTCTKTDLLTVDTDTGTVSIPSSASSSTTAIGTGTDDAGNIITYPLYPERDQSTVNVNVTKP